MAKHEIEGMKELMKRLENMGEESKTITKEVLTEAVQPAKKEIEKNAPSNKYTHPYEKKYGKLKNNIELEWDDKKQQMNITTSDSFWSWFLEFGTKSMKKQPFIEPSYHNTKKEVEQNIIEGVKKRLNLP
ncbi:HK97-gp10 family putative phage morphogenesis protein [Cytobacillus firmus]|uniref:HK97-gp10 family putative phage morphogenesis protein n=1 Tax=Cytobacillus firmus TaxID=1399 RepID=UPI0018CE2524|nr:HK97-gp10 family putative phage morphogenesis protein [Cytobacillus firmus]MBG9657093.1 hypothetical protein [Cytobacillus firmus]MED1906766.1 HK97 gp10 family phage protein [Cytobacillus firmus]